MTILEEMRGRDSSVGGENSGCLYGDVVLGMVTAQCSVCVAPGVEEYVGEDGTRAVLTLRGHIERRLHFRSRNRSVPFWPHVWNGINLASIVCA